MRRSGEEPLVRPPPPLAVVVPATQEMGATAMVTAREEIPAAAVVAVLRWDQPAVAVVAVQRVAISPPAVVVLLAGRRGQGRVRRAPNAVPKAGGQGLSIVGRRAAGVQRRAPVAGGRGRYTPHARVAGRRARRGRLRAPRRPRAA
jgi:hypothetical protein